MLESKTVFSAIALEKLTGWNTSSTEIKLHGFRKDIQPFSTSFLSHKIEEIIFILQEHCGDEMTKVMWNCILKIMTCKANVIYNINQVLLLYYYYYYTTTTIILLFYNE